MNYKKLDLDFYKNAIAGYQLKNKKVFIKHDEFAEDPLEWGNFNFLSLSSKYYVDREYKGIFTKSGDIFVPLETFNSLLELEKFFINNNYLYQFVQCYEHSNLSIQISEYNKNDRLLDGYNFGFLYVSKDNIKKNYGVNKITDKIEKEVYLLMESFVKNEWQDYIDGEVYCCSLFKDDKHIETIGGFYGLKSIDEHTLKNFFNQEF